MLQTNQSQHSYHTHPHFNNEGQLEKGEAFVAFYRNVLNQINNLSAENNSGDLRKLIPDLYPSYFKNLAKYDSEEDIVFFQDQLDNLQRYILDPGTNRQIIAKNPLNPKEVLVAEPVALLSRNGFIGKIFEKFTYKNYLDYNNAIFKEKGKINCPITVMRVDIGDFRLIDESGEGVGDYTLGKIAANMVSKCAIVNKALREAGIDLEVIVGRESGDELVIGILGEISPTYAELIYDIFVNQENGIQSIDTYKVVSSGSSEIIASKVLVKNKREFFRLPPDISDPILREKIGTQMWKHLQGGLIVMPEELEKEERSGEVKLSERILNYIRNLKDLAINDPKLITALGIVNKARGIAKAYSAFAAKYKNTEPLISFINTFIHDRMFGYPFYSIGEIIERVGELNLQGKSYNLVMLEVPAMTLYNDLFSHGVGDKAIEALGWNLLEIIVKYQVAGFDISLARKGPAFILVIPNEQNIENSKDLTLESFYKEINSIPKAELAQGGITSKIMYTNIKHTPEITQQGPRRLTSDAAKEIARKDISGLFMISESQFMDFICDYLLEDVENISRTIETYLKENIKPEFESLSDLFNDPSSMVTSYFVQKRTAKRLSFAIERLRSKSLKDPGNQNIQIAITRLTHLLCVQEELVSSLPVAASQRYTPSILLADFLKSVPKAIASKVA